MVWRQGNDKGFRSSTMSGMGGGGMGSGGMGGGGMGSGGMGGSGMSGGGMGGSGMSGGGMGGIGMGGGGMGSGGMGSGGMAGLSNVGMGMGSGMGLSGNRGILGESPATSSIGMSAFNSMGIDVTAGLLGSTNNDNIDAMLQQRRLQQQLSLRESQLALASDLLQKQNQMFMDVGYTGPNPNMGGGMMPNQPGMSRQMIPSLLDIPQHNQQGKRMGLMGREPPDNKRRRQRSSSPRDRFDRRSGNREHFSPNRRHNDGGRDRSGRSSRWDTEEKPRSRTRSEEYDPANPTNDEGGDFRRQNFRSHMNSNRHQERMDNIMAIHKQKSSQYSARMKAQEHLKRLEGANKLGFCKLCDEELAIPFLRHKVSIVHKKREMQVRKGCGWCGVADFSNFAEVLLHRATQKHKQNAAKQDDKNGTEKKPSSTTTTSRPSRDSDRRSRPSSSRTTSKSKTSTSSTPSKHSRTDDDSMPELKYDKDVSIGQNYVIPVSGFFCKLCHKFYNTEQAAKVTHCQSEQHFQMYKKAKIAAKVKAKAQKAKPTATSTPISDKNKVEAEDWDKTIEDSNKEKDEQNANVDKEDVSKGNDEEGAGEKDKEEDMDTSEGADKPAAEDWDKEEAEEAAKQDTVDKDSDLQEKGDSEDKSDAKDEAAAEVAASPEVEVIAEDEASAEEGDAEEDVKEDDDVQQDDAEQEVEDEKVEEEDAKAEENKEDSDSVHDMTGEIHDLTEDLTEEEQEKLLQKEEGESDVGDVDAEVMFTEIATELTPTSRGRGRGRARRGKRGAKK